MTTQGPSYDPRERRDIAARLYARAASAPGKAAVLPPYWFMEENALSDEQRENMLADHRRLLGLDVGIQAIRSALDFDRLKSLARELPGVETTEKVPGWGLVRLAPGFLKSADWEGDPERVIRLLLLGAVVREAGLLIRQLLEHGRTFVPWDIGGLEITLAGSKADVKVGEYGQLFDPSIFDLIRERPFPFGMCAVCSTVFVQPHRGKRRRYCSGSCKAKGIPSATKRTEYAREYRHRKREAEILRTRRVLRAWPKQEQFAELRKQFPTKPHRELLYLLRRAPVSQGESASKSKRKKE